MLDIIKNISFSIDIWLVLIYGLIIFIFLVLFTKKDSSTYSLHTVISAIFIAPVVEEMLCREISYNSDHLLLSFFISSFIFISLHLSFDIRSILYFFIISSFLFFLKAQSNSVLNSILLHSFINLVIIIRMNF
ncbi:CPBP family glutamic-type intramembrane protease [Streptococcus ruminantium]